MITLPDTYYTTKVMDGYPEPARPSPLLQFYQGTDIVFQVYLNFDEAPVSPDDWDITGIVKTTPTAVLVTWQGALNNGIYKSEQPGVYTIQIPSSVTSTFFAGTYWLDILIVQKIGKNKGPKDLTEIIGRYPFSVDYSAASPNPYKVDDKAGIELTLPQSTDPTIGGNNLDDGDALVPQLNSQGVIPIPE